MGCAGRYTLGYHMAYDGWLGLPDVPVEEATFFVVTNMMCLQVLMKSCICALICRMVF